MNTGHPDDDPGKSVPAPSPEGRLRAAVKEYQDVLWAADAPVQQTNHSVRQWQEVSAVHGIVHPDTMVGKLKCPGPLEETMRADQKWCDLASPERGSKERVMTGMEELLKQGWAIHVAIERGVNYQITVKALSGTHLGQRITATTDNTEATGVLQGFRHDSDAINIGNPMRDDWVLGM